MDADVCRPANLEIVVVRTSAERNGETAGLEGANLLGDEAEMIGGAHGIGCAED